MSEHEALGAALLGRARRSIESQLGLDVGLAVDERGALPEMAAPGACFVTLTQHGHLRGCIGSLEAYRALRDDVWHNAQAAAFRDPRFAPITADEWPTVRVEVSLLSTPERLQIADEHDLCAQLRPGIDGVIFQAAGRRSTFLPQVWDQLPDPTIFMAHLKEKAGVRASYWGDDVQIWRYGVQKWKEGAP